MREYKFRGKIIDHRTRFIKTLGYKVGDWIYGENISTEHDDIDKDKIHVFICGIRVDPDTVGQYTGIKDIEGNLVYEDDILVNREDNEKVYGEVFWSKEDAKFLIQFKNKNDKYKEDIYIARYCTVVDNIWDNEKIYVYTEKEEDINKMTKGMDLSEIDQNYETYSNLRDLLDDANNAGEFVLKQQYFDTFYVAEIDQSKNKLVGINKYKVSVKIEKVE